MHPPLSKTILLLSISILITTSSCTPTLATSSAMATFPPATLTSTATQRPSTLTPTSTLLSATPSLSIPPSPSHIISAGGDHTCALTAAGGVRCWGENGHGQLGDGTTIPSSTPVAVVGLESGVLSLAVGEGLSCALTASGGLKCWGLNESGELGDGTTTNRLTPVDVVSLSSGVSAVSVGGSRACAVTAAGGVKCWGLIWHGQERYGNDNFISIPMDVAGLSSGVKAISNGYNHICALTTTGGVKCWGFNALGQLGDGTTKEDSSIPVDVVGLGSGIAAITSGSNHTCALTVSGGVKCWGDNTYGQLGDGTHEASSAPVDVSGLDASVVAIAAGGANNCALTASGGLLCWGYGFLGDGTTDSSSSPVKVTGMGSGVSAAAVGAGHTCALTDDGKLKCWGRNEFGQLGDGLAPVSVSAVEVLGLDREVAAISVGGINTCALMAAGGVKCWGPGFISASTTSERSIPVDLADMDNEITALALGGYATTCALTAAGGVSCLDNRGQPVTLAGLENGATAVFGGILHMCALTASGGVKCWGQNNYGQLGDGTTLESALPVDVSGLQSGVTALAPGYFHTCALMDTGGVRCWGWNGFGQLGDGTQTDRLTPGEVVGIGERVTAVAAGGYHTCVLTTSGGVKCWGSNEQGQLGDGAATLTPVYAPLEVVGLGEQVIAITAGEHHTCALTASGGVKCWGSNDYGQLGDGTLADRAIAVDVLGLGEVVIAIDAGNDHTCALTAAGGVQCWGNDSMGQMGDGRLLWSTIPVEVIGWEAQRGE